MPDSLIDRIKEKRQQAKSLMSPWLRTTDGEGSAGAGELPFTERKRIAALKMRVLDDRKLGNAHPEHVRTFGAGISEKMQSIQDLVHFSPAIERDPSIWSQLDRVYPTASPEAPRTPEQPGVMRAGTVIQKFSMTPKPGQSIESFKEQASRFSQTKPPATRVQKPALPSRARLFSRVQEFNAGEKEPVERPEETQPTLAAPTIDETLSSEAAGQTADPITPAAQATPEPRAQAPKSETGQPATQEHRPAPPKGKRLKASPDSPSETPPALPLRTLDTTPVAPESITDKKPAVPAESRAETHALQESEPQSRTPPVHDEIPAKSPGEETAQPVKLARQVSKTGEPAASIRAERASAKPAQPSSQKPANLIAARPANTVQRQPDVSESPRLPQAAPSSSDRPASTGPAQTVQRKPDPSVSQRPPQAVRRESDESSAFTAPQTLSRKPDLPVSPGPVLTGQDPAEAAPFTPPLLVSKSQKPVLPVQQPAVIPPPAFKAEAAPLETSTSSRSETLPVAPAAKKATNQPLEMPPAAPPSEPKAIDQLREREPAQPALPLHTRLVERKGATRTLKPAVPEALRQVQSKPLVQPQPPLVSSRKYKLETTPASSTLPPQMPAHAGSPSANATVQREMDISKPPISSAPTTGPVSMVLADVPVALPPAAGRAPAAPAVPVSPVANQSANQTPQAGAATQPQKTSEARIRPLKMSKGGVVQRRWDEHSGPDSVSSSGSERSQETEQTPVDLDQLASDVLPLIKRLLEIELERSSGGFH